ncbi:acyl carrier protein [Paraburkholderia sp. D15]|uniref:acyl carrier protein n=1 Tax=Paraburkholderia sp. D15 TaxID=2880218 RepID=UPI00247AF4DE|nr:acyl carrier protein [Paraburkholderia sp. D15]WGS51082.1 acyl carrier protein [Paraburkholderia sp. D15]
MLQLPPTTPPAFTGASDPSLSLQASTGDPGSMMDRLLARAQDAQDLSIQQLSNHLDQLGSGRVSTIDLLRMQADMGAYSVRVQMTVRVADQIGNAIQTLSQRS